MANRANWAAQLVFGCLIVLMSLAVLAAADTEQPVVVSELVGGISSTAVFTNPGFFDAAHACFKQYPYSEFHAAAGERQKNCLADYMQRHGATAQAIAFMRAAPVPAAIAAVRVYGPTRSSASPASSCRSGFRRRSTTTRRIASSCACIRAYRCAVFSLRVCHA